MSTLRGVFLDKISLSFFQAGEAGRGETPNNALTAVKLIENDISTGWWKGVVICLVHFQITSLILEGAYLAFF